MIKTILVVFLALFTLQANAGRIVASPDDQVVCEQCAASGNWVVKGTEPASSYTQMIETPNYSFIKEDLGSSCYGGGWYAIDKNMTQPTAKKVGTDCKEITNAKAWEDGKVVFFQVTYYGGKKVVYKYERY